MVRRTLASCLVIAACGGGSSATDDAGTSTDAPASTSGGAVESSGVHGESSGAGTSSSASTTSVDTSGEASSSSAQDESSESAIDPCATLPDPSPKWLIADLQDTVARLSGESELQPGITLSDRAGAMRRGQAAAWLLERFGELGLDGQGHGYGSGTNVWARLPATVASEGTLVLGAHYDGVPNSPAAADNGTGTAAVLAAARHLQEVECRRYDVIFVLFDEEESGLVGSSAYAGKLITDDEPIVAVHSIDMISFDGDGDGVIEIDQPDAGLFELYEAAAMELGLAVVATDSVATDYQSFQQAGIPACGLMEEWNNGDHTPYWHTPMDSYAQIDFEYLATGSALVHHTFARLLNPDAG
ncbi:MAG TPA: M28 family peptidase [Nannocystaceae bacterium]|nr:M28 family peptidase [Nannocystaceae bacterium]